MANIRPQKILIIDEISYTRLGIDYALTNNGYRVTSVSNGSEAMKTIANELPDLILISLRSNDTNGIDIIKGLKEYFRLRLDIAQGAEPSIIALIVSRDTNLFRDLQYHGISIILFKPINIQELPEVISSVLSKEHKPITQERKKILIFDGEARSQQFIESMLINENYDFEKCESEAEAIAKIRKRKFDLGIMDISSFENDPLETLKQVREKSPDMFIITISAFGGQVSTEEFQKPNIQRHFTKPMDVHELQVVVDKFMNKDFSGLLTEDDSEENSEAAVDNIIDGLTERVGSEESDSSDEI